MKCRYLRALWILIMTGAALPVLGKDSAASTSDLTISYNKPAEKWLEALPVGNGRLGGMVFGGIAQERIQLNDDTLWSGAPKDWNNPEALKVLPRIRQLIFEGNYAEAHELGKKMMGPYTQSYLPMGNLRIKMDHASEASDYRRGLDLDSAIAFVRYSVGGIEYAREIFSSYPDQVLVMRLSASKPGNLSLTASLDSQLHFRTAARKNSLVLRGKAPLHADPNYYPRDNPIRYAPDQTGEGMNFECHLGAVLKGGRLETGEGNLTIHGADEVILILSAATSFNGFDKSPGLQGKDPAPIAASQLANALRKGHAALRGAHVDDHQRLFRRVQLDLGPSPSGAGGLATDERLRKFGADDPGLVALHYQYGRYLLIASSRPGTQPPNLQGIWNDEMRPPWSSNWTININAEMNMWPAEVANLPECHEPLFDLIRELAGNGKKTAMVNYGARGWVAHHNTDIWRQSAPVGDFGHGDATWALWPMSGPWLCSHLWQHYEFSGDQTFLREKAYPLMKGAAEFCLDFLVEGREGYLVTAPSTSPENRFVAPDGKNWAVTAATAMDITLIRDLFKRCIAASEILKVDTAFREQLRKAGARLAPLKIGEGGRLQEWDRDFKDAEPHHRHVSHLWGLYPGNEITRESAPGLFEAARRSLELRTDEGTGWSSGWKISLWARLGDGNHALQLIRRTLRLEDGGVYLNLFGSHPPFQMDSNFAFPAGISEMLLQSHEGDIHFLPALPSAWPDGSIHGLRARGGFEVDLQWKGGRLDSAEVRSKLGGTRKARYGGKEVWLKTAPGKSYRLDSSLQVMKDPSPKRTGKP